MSTQRKRISVVRAAIFVAVLSATIPLTLKIITILVSDYHWSFSEPLRIGVVFGVFGFVYSIGRQLIYFPADDAVRHPATQVSPDKGYLGKICISRETSYADSHRAYVVCIDDQAIGELMPGQTATFEVPYGEHKVQVKIDWARSNALNTNVTNQQPERLKVRSSLQGARVVFAAWYALLRPRSYLRLEHC